MTKNPHILFSEERDGIRTSFKFYPDNNLQATSRYLDLNFSVKVSDLSATYDDLSFTEKDRQKMDKAMRACYNAALHVKRERISVAQPVMVM